ncbi:MAG TPA: ATP-binding protein [Candidatus Ornithoclostridium excrementipullorum]|nr:ATP-binding protein [Candidatus Ornithoclostridium excrementipullorum]
MTERERIYSQIRASRDAVRRAEDADAERRLDKARAIPEFARAEADRNSAAIACARAAAAKTENAEKAKTDLEKAEAAYADVLKKYGLDVAAHRRCPICEDRGFAHGKLCSCAQREYMELLKASCGAEHIPQFGFADDKSASSGCAQKDDLGKLYSAMKKFCDKFYDSRIRFILLTGQSGVGKSSLAYAVANELLAQGVPVFCTSAFDMNALLLKYHTSPLEARGKYMAPLLESDFLVIDDLGAENILKNVTCEYLYNIIESRINHGKRTMVTTNLSLEELMRRYGERTVSRMVNKNYSLMREIVGDDLRLVFGQKR